MYRRMFTYLMIIPIIVFLSSCSNSTNPVVTVSMSEYYPSSVGSWWKYENWILDSNGTRVKLDYKDSVVSIGTINLKGKIALMFLSYNLDFHVKPDTNEFYYTEGSKLYGYMPTDLSSFQNPFQDMSKLKWVMFADMEGTNWTIMNDSVSVDTLSYSLKQTFRMTGSKGIQKDYTIKGVTIHAQQFKYSVKFKTTMVLFGQETITESEMQTEIWLGKGVGLIHTITKIIKEEGLDIGNNSEMILYDYNIK